MENLTRKPGSKKGFTRVTVGVHVAIELISTTGEREPMEFDIVPDDQADYYAGFLGEGTPLAKALLNQMTGSTIPFNTGDSLEILILSITNAQGDGKEISERRQAARQEALKQAEKSQMITFATTFDSKWGDYDPDIIRED